ncbi:MAG: vWA domain-containing protein [Myxococcaceae bacterium]
MSSLSKSSFPRLLGLVAALSAAAVYAEAPVAPRMERVAHRVPKVQIAILLDNSGSMSGLLNQARTQIWKLVNEFKNARRDGERAQLEIALYEYGAHPVMLSNFTRDLDGLSEKLFSLSIRGGDEYCGEVIQKATRELEWSGNADDLKLIYIAGNEPFTQGPVSYASAITAATKRGITVNTIHCGGDEPTWREGARVAGGSFTMINQNAAIAYVPAPQDAEIARLGAALNKTYVGYGAAAPKRAERQAAQDGHAAVSGMGIAVSRAVAKSTANYDNRDWDMVDAVRAGKIAAPSAAPEAELPAEMKPMAPAERDAYVATKAKDRADIQKKIAELSAEREKFLEAERAKQGTKGENTLDDALIQSVRKEAAKKSLSL